MSEGFEVDPSFLDGYSGQMARASGHMNQIEQYTRSRALEGLDHMGLEGSLLQGLYEAAFFFADERSGHYNTLKIRIAESSQALQATSDRYRKTEKRVNEIVDKTHLPAPSQRPIPPDSRPSGPR